MFARKNILAVSAACLICLFASAANAATEAITVASGNTSVTLGGVIFSISETQPAGTGIFDPFLRYQANGIEEGFNHISDGTISASHPFGQLQGPDVDLDEKASPHTHAVEAALALKVNIGGIDYWSLEEDVNESNGANDPQGKRFLSLDMIEVYATNDPTLTDYPFSVPGEADLLFDWGDNHLLYEDLHHGSGEADLFALIPASATDKKYLIFYFKQGVLEDADNPPEDPVNAEADAGFEEWRIRIIPLPAAAWSDLGMLGALGIAKKIRSNRRTA